MSNRIGVDVDGVLAQFNEAFIDLIIKETGIDLFPPRPFDIPTWHYPQLYGYNNKDHLNMVWDKINESETFWLRLKPYPEANEVIAQLGGRVLKGDDVYFITTRPSCGIVSAKSQTEQWLEYKVFDDFTPTVIVTADKGPIAKALDLTHFIDDKWENVRDVKDDAPDCKVYLLDRAWNRTIPITSIPRVNSVMEMLKELD